MIHQLGKIYGISPLEAELLTEYDFFLMVAEENLQSLKQDYIINSSK